MQMTFSGVPGFPLGHQPLYVKPWTWAWLQSLSLLQGPPMGLPPGGGPGQALPHLPSEQISPAGHWPQSSLQPHPSGIDPHTAPCCWQVRQAGKHWLPQQAPPAPHVHLSVAPHPSGMLPQKPAGQVLGTQLLFWQEPLTQLCPDAQDPQVMRPPQPFEMLPHVTPCAEHVVGMQPPPVPPVPLVPPAPPLPHVPHPLDVTSPTQMTSQLIWQQ